MAETTTMLAVASVFSALATTFVVLRMVSRMKILRKASIDDYLIVLAVIFSWFQTGSIYAQAQFGSGKHIQQIRLQDYSNLLLALWVGLPLYNIALALTKVSALCQLLRFFTTPTTRTVALVLIAIVSMFGLAISLSSIFSCHPINVFWSANEEAAVENCINLIALWYTNAAFNIGTDIAVVVLPLYVLRDLQNLPRLQKWGVNAIFLVGGVACVTSILRLHSIYRGYNSSDFSYQIADIETWCAVEVNTAIICACMQSLKPLVGRVNARWRTQARKSNNTSTSSSSTIELKGPRLNHSNDTKSTTVDTMTGIELNGPAYVADRNANNRR